LTPAHVDGQEVAHSPRRVGRRHAMDCTAW
jgi:hypothetical protein